MQLERRQRFAWRDQIRILIPLVVVWGVGSGVIAFFALQERVSREALFLDTNATADLPWYTGLISNIGILGWTVAATFAGAGAYLSWKTGRPKATRLLAQGSALTALLCFDDLFQFHNDVVPHHTPVPKPAVLAVYGACTIMWVRFNIRELARTRWQILAAALAAFVTSLVVDKLNDGHSDKLLILEDGPKLLGILAFGLFFALIGRDIVISTLVARREGAPVSRR